MTAAGVRHVGGCGPGMCCGHAHTGGTPLRKIASVAGSVSVAGLVSVSMISGAIARGRHGTDAGALGCSSASRRVGVEVDEHRQRR